MCCSTVAQTPLLATTSVWRFASTQATSSWRMSAAVVAEARHHKIALRCGDFLSPRLLDAVLPADARPAGVVRVSLAHYNTVAEVDRLCAALERMEKW